MAHSGAAAAQKTTPTFEQICYSRLLAYIKASYPGYIIGKHHALIAQSLMAVERGEIPRLMIFLPPRSGKTFEVSEYFPSWYIGRNPSRQIIATTYSQEKANDTGRKVRNLLLDPLHGSIFPSCHLSKDAKGITRFATQEGGVYHSVGIGGAIVGRGAHLFLIDDPVKSREDAESDLVRRKHQDWFRAVAYTRLMPGGAIVIMMTRWHFDDLAGWALKELADQNWTVISIPAICEKKDSDALGREPGETFWPNYPLFTLDNLNLIKNTVGPREWNAQYQQNPLPSEGGIVRYEWFKWYEEPEKEYKRVVHSWDTASKGKELNDPSGLTVWGESKAYHDLLFADTRHYDYPDLKMAVKNFAAKKSIAPSVILIEDAGSGQDLIMDLRKETTLPIIPVPTRNIEKDVRMSTESDQIMAGRVRLPEGKPLWLTDYITEMCRFPLYKWDEYVDSTSQYLWWIRGRYSARPVEILGI